MKIVLIAVDTLRADHLGCWGYHSATSANLDAVAAEGFVLGHCFAVSNCTHPGFTALFTGCYPETTAITGHWTRVDLPEDAPTVAGIAKANGLVTLAVDNLYDRWQERWRLYPWFRRAYDMYEYAQDPNAHESANCDLVCDLIHKHAADDFLLFYHPWYPHAPYQPPDDCQHATWDKSDPLADVVSRYDGEIVYADREIGRIVEALRAAGIYDDTLLIITSDHGEIMGEDRLVRGHRFNVSHIDLGDECLRIPLVMRWPGVVPTGRSDALVQQPDLLPTLAGLAGWELARAVDGESLAPVMRGDVSSVRDAVHFMENTYQKQRGIRTATHKLKLNLDPGDSAPRRELYDLAVDPLEQFNIVDVEPELADELEARMAAWVGERLAAAGHTEDPLLAQDITAGTLHEPGRFARERQLAHAYLRKERNEGSLGQ
ncbi:MAG: sulfatase [Armatimonadota bacterium]|nr:MAG: sulfatase [Armatimonadota bacterium]